MKNIYSKIIRDIKELKERFIALFFIIFLGAFISTGLFTFSSNFLDSLTNYYSNNNLADIWISYSHIDKDEINDLLNIKGIKNVEIRNSFTSTHKYDSTSANLKLYSLPNNISINKPYLISGNFPTSNNDILIDNQYAKAHNLSINDELPLTINGTDKTFIIKGLCESVEYIWKVDKNYTSIPNSDIFGIGYVSENALNTILGSEFYNELLVDLDEDSVYTDIFVIEDIKANSNTETFLQEYTRRENSNFMETKSKSALIFLVSTILAVIFLCISLVVSIITFKEFINIKKEEMGILKSLGFSTFNISIGYYILGIITAITASLSGSIIGSIVIQKIANTLINNVFIIPVLKDTFNTGYILKILLFSTFALIMATYKACNTTLKKSPLEAMKE